MKNRLDAKVFVAPLGSRSQQGSQKEPELRRKLGLFIDVAFVPSGLEGEPTSDVRAASSLIENELVPAGLCEGASAHWHYLVPGHSTASGPSDRQKRRERRMQERRGSEERGDDSTPCHAEAENVPGTVLSSGRHPRPAQEVPVTLPMPISRASASDDLGEADSPRSKQTPTPLSPR